MICPLSSSDSLHSPGFQLVILWGFYGKPWDHGHTVTARLPLLNGSRKKYRHSRFIYIQDERSRIVFFFKEDLPSSADVHLGSSDDHGG